MTITPLPDPPSTSDPANFETKADALIAALPIFVSQANALGTELFLTIRNYISGLTLSTAGSSATFGIAAGQAADSTNTTLMELPSSLSKTTSAWGPGDDGALDTGTINTGTVYHAYEIQRPDTGEVDACISLSGSAPTFGAHIPAAYTRYRRIGSMKTDGSAQWIKFTQKGDEFLLDARVTDANASPANTNAITVTLGSIPTGIKVDALLTGLLIYGSTTTAGIISSLDVSDQSAASTYDLYVTSAATQHLGQFITRTNTSAQVRARFSATGATYVLVTKGWIDRRGRDG